MQKHKVQLTDLRQLQQMFSFGMQECGVNYLTASLTKKEKTGAIARESQAHVLLHPSAKHKFLKKDLRMDRLKNIHLSEFFGYIAPDQIESYFIDVLQQEFHGAGLLHRIKINFKDEWDGERVGEFSYYRPCRENEVPDGIAPLIDEKRAYSGSLYEIISGPVFLRDKDKILIKYIIEDNSGLVVPISIQRIEALIANRQPAVYSFFSDVFVLPDLIKAKRLAQTINNEELAERVESEIEKIPAEEKATRKEAEQAREQRSFFPGTPAYRVELSGKLEEIYARGKETVPSGYNSCRGVLSSDNIDNISPDLFPFSLNQISGVSLAELRKYFAIKGVSERDCETHMKVTQIR